MLRRSLLGVVQGRGPVDAHRLRRSRHGHLGGIGTGGPDHLLHRLPPIGGLMLDQEVRGTTLGRSQRLGIRGSTDRTRGKLRPARGVKFDTSRDLNETRGIYETREGVRRVTGQSLDESSSSLTVRDSGIAVAAESRPKYGGHPFCSATWDTHTPIAEQDRRGCFSILSTLGCEMADCPWGGSRPADVVSRRCRKPRRPTSVALVVASPRGVGCERPRAARRRRAPGPSCRLHLLRSDIGFNAGCCDL